MRPGVRTITIMKSMKRDGFPLTKPGRFWRSRMKRTSWTKRKLLWARRSDAWFGSSGVLHRGRGLAGIRELVPPAIAHGPERHGAPGQPLDVRDDSAGPGLCHRLGVSPRSNRTRGTVRACACDLGR